MTHRFAHELQAGDRYASLEFTVTPEMNQQALFSVEDFNPLYIHGGDGHGPLVHPVVLMHMSPRTRSPSYRQASDMGSALARDRSIFLGVAEVGEVLHIDWLISQTYEQRGRIYQDYVASVTNAAGKAVLRREMSATFFTLGKVKTFALEGKV